MHVLSRRSHPWSGAFHIDRSGALVAIDAEAAWACSECVEPVFEEKTVVAVQRIIQAVGEESANLAAAAPNPPPY